MVRIEAGLAAVGALLLSTGAAAKTVTYDGPSDNCTAQVVAALGGLGDGDTLVFPKGEYHFGTEGALRRELAPSNNQTGEKNVVFPLIDKRNVTIEGGGSVFVFHGSTFPFAAQESRGLVLRNFTVRTPLPVHAGFRVTASDEDGFTVRFDEGTCPWEVKDGELVFRLEDRLLTTASGKMSMHALDRFCVHYLVTAAADPVHDLRNLPAGYSAVTPEARADGTVRFRYRTGSPGPSRTIPYAVGERLAINLEERRWRDAFFFEDCDGVRVENVTISRFGGMGLVAQRSGNLTYDGVKILPEPGDTVALTADMMQFIACYGQVTVQNCEGAHTMDDVIDVHGNYLGVEGQDGARLRLRALHEDHKGFFPVRPGDDVEFVSMPSREIVGKARVATVAPDPSDRYLVTVTVEGPLPELKGKVYLENVTLYPDVVFRRNRFHHYPNLRFSGRGKCLIEDNRLEHGWSALLVLDLPDFWYESGRVTDMTIRNNTFVDCNAIGGDTFIQIGVSGWNGEKTPKIHGRIVLEGNRYEKVKKRRVSVSGVREFVNLDEDPHACTVKVTDCGARGDDAADDTAGFQKALDTAARPLEVVVPPGTYYLDGTAKVGSDTTIRCEPGARIVLSSARPHRRGEFLLTNRNKETGDRNIRLVGGVWDGNAREGNNVKPADLFATNGWSGATLNFQNVRGLRLTGLTLANSVTYNVRMCRIDGFEIRDIAFAARRLGWNQDGLHFNGFCFNGTIENIRAVTKGQTNDDMLAFNADDIMTRVENLDMVCGPITNVICRNIFAEDCHTAVRLLSFRSTISDVTVSNITAGVRTYAINADAARYCLTPMFREADHPNGVGCLRNVVLEDATFWATAGPDDEPLLDLESNIDSFVVRGLRRDARRDAHPRRPMMRIRNIAPVTLRTGAGEVRPFALRESCDFATVSSDFTLEGDAAVIEGWAK